MNKVRKTLENEEGSMDIDERVAREIMGWDENLTFSTNKWYFVKEDHKFRNEYEDWQPSTRIEQAMMVVAKLREKHQFYLEWDSIGDVIVMFGDSFEMAITNRFDTIDALAELICLASLKAKEGEREQGFQG